MTIDTNCVIYAAQGHRYRSELEELVDLARNGRVALALTSAFEIDQEKAPEQKRTQNLTWLSKQPTIARIPQPFRLDYHPLDDPGHVLLGGERDAAVLTALEQIVLPPDLQVGQVDADDAAAMKTFRRKVSDVQHLAGHAMSGNDVFVTEDKDDMLDNKDKILAATGIRIADIPTAVALARQA
jgi:hypothetical protein